MKILLGTQLVEVEKGTKIIVIEYMHGDNDFRTDNVEIISNKTEPTIFIKMIQILDFIKEKTNIIGESIKSLTLSEIIDYKFDIENDEYVSISWHDGKARDDVIPLDVFVDNNLILDYTDTTHTYAATLSDSIVIEV